MAPSDERLRGEGRYGVCSVKIVWTFQRWASYDGALCKSLYFCTFTLRSFHVFLYLIIMRYKFVGNKLRQMLVLIQTLPSWSLLPFYLYFDVFNSIRLYWTDFPGDRWVMSMDLAKVWSGWTTCNAWEQKHTLLTVSTTAGHSTTADTERMCRSAVILVRTTFIYHSRHPLYLWNRCIDRRYNCYCNILAPLDDRLTYNLY